MPITIFPAILQNVAQIMPSYHLAELALIAGGLRAPDQFWVHVAVTGLWTLVLAFAVAWAVRRESD